MQAESASRRSVRDGARRGGAGAKGVACSGKRMPRKKGRKLGAGKHATGQRKGKGASVRLVEQRAAAPDGAAAPAAPVAHAPHGFRDRASQKTA